ncbi:MAG: 50S ribosomal protein L6, partial [Paracoccus sp. (in: a-proteobacteria)]|uniref:50S ribosomal protein L6 n=1 Tax=Paracoccus sp. TaxID=267 RepID=UPI004058C7DD
MSRIGKLPVAIPSSVTATLTDTGLTVKGPKGELSMTFVDDVKVTEGEDGITVRPVDDSKKSWAMWGMQRAIIANLVHGVSEGFEKDLELVGVGYRAQMQGSSL